MSALFSHAIRHGLWKEANPIASVRQSAKRQSIPALLSVDEMRSLVRELEYHPLLCTAILVAAASALRRSEINGLKWEDVDWEGKRLFLKRGRVGKDDTDLKTEASKRPLPVEDDLLEVLQSWRDRSPYPADDDWVFASEQVGGRSPLWFGVALQDHIQPAAKRAGILKKVGWHTFRHSFATLLSTEGENVKVVQELLRHANSSITLQLYQQADDAQKRLALKHTHRLFAVA